MLVRDLTGDPPDLADVSAFVVDGRDELLVPDVVLVETAKVLASVYRVPRETVLDHVIALLRKANIDTLRLFKDLLLGALLLCRPSGRISFADALVWAAVTSETGAAVFSLDERFPDEGITIPWSALGESCNSHLHCLPRLPSGCDAVCERTNVAACVHVSVQL